MIKAVFFDLGGTLLVTRRDRILHGILVEAGYNLSLKAVRASYEAVEPAWLQHYATHPATGPESSEAYRRLNVSVIEHLGIARGREESDRLSQLVRDRWEAVGRTVPHELYPDAEPVLSRLNSLRITTALVSNAPPDTAKTVEELRLPLYIKHIIISGVVGYSKPNPEIFRIALARAAASPDQAVHVGDVYASDVLGARSAGIRGILLDRDGVSGAKDCPVIRGLSEVLPLVASAQ